mgnify:CR=1 FL=1
MSAIQYKGNELKFTLEGNKTLTMLYAIHDRICKIPNGNPLAAELFELCEPLFEYINARAMDERIAIESFDTLFDSPNLQEANDQQPEQWPNDVDYNEMQREWEKFDATRWYDEFDYDQPEWME